MNKDRIFCLKLSMKEKTYRFSTDKVSVSESIAGETVEVNYLPYIISISLNESSISYDGSWSVPSVNITAWDGFRALASIFELNNYEISTGHIFYTDKNSETVDVFRGYITDVSFEDTRLSFSVRADDEMNVSDLLTVFNFDTFQKSQIFSPSKINVVPYFEVNEETPWSFVGHESPRFITAFSFGPKNQPIILGEATDPVFQSRLENAELSDSYREALEQYEDELGQPIHELYNQLIHQYISGQITAGELSASLAPILGVLREIQKKEFLKSAGALEWHIYDAPWVESYDITFLGELMSGEATSVTTVNKSFAVKSYVYDPTSDTFSVDLNNNEKLYADGSPGLSGYMIATDVCTTQDVDLGFNRLLFPRWSSLQAGINQSAIANDSPDSFSYQYAFNVLCSHEVFAYKNISRDSQDRLRVNFYTVPEIIDSLTYGRADFIKFRHAKGTALTYYGRPEGVELENPGVNILPSAHDYVWVKCDGMRPSDINSVEDIIKSKYKFGFIYAGQNGLLKSTDIDEEEGEDSPGEQGAKNPDRYRVKLFHRYQIVGFEKPEDNTGIKTHFYLKLKLHNRGFDPYRHVAAPPRGGAFDIASYEFPDWIKKGDPIKLVNMKWMVESLDYTMTGLTSEEVFEVQTLLEYDDKIGIDRFKSLRVDAIRNVSDYLIDSDSETQQDEESNDRLVNNASGQFATVVSSKTFVEDGLLKEKIEFDSRATNNYRISFNDLIPTASGLRSTPIPIINQFFDTTALVYPMTFTSSPPRAATNYMIASGKDISDNYYYSSMDIGRAAALDFFRSKHYRIIHDPVPENSSDLGSNIPIIYGAARRVPMVQVISNKSITAKDLTAGDDTYIYSSHPCNIINPSDIVIELLNEKGQNPEEALGKAISEIETEVLNNLIISPFPKYLDDHFKVDYGSVRDAELGGFKSTTTFDGPQRIYNPYYHLVNPVTNTGQTMYGIKLRGAEWKSEAGATDRRYAIRNGVGSSRLYASFSGWVDNSGKYTGRSGSVICHPLDIVRHFNDFYCGTSATGKVSFNIENINNIKARTGHYRASIVINDKTTVYDLIKAINQQFGLHSYYKNGSIYFTLIDGTYVNYDCPVSESLNLLKGIKQGSIGYGDIYNEVRYNYSKNWVTDKYDGSLILNSKNNKYCAQAEKVFGGKKQFSVDCNYVNSSGIINEVANRMAKILCSKKNEYSLSVRPMEGFIFEPGMFVPLTCSYLGLENQPVMILSVKENESVTELKVVHLVNF
jgi:hypothetical protein